MKKLNYLIGVSLVAMLATSCSTVTYMPHNVNNYGTQTQVVLSQANFKIIRNVEYAYAYDKNSIGLEKAKNCAYMQLLRNCNLKGSQALINVSIEEIRKDYSDWWRNMWSGAVMPKRQQYVVARATIIEFLPEGVVPESTVSSNGAVTTRKAVERPKLDAAQQRAANKAYLAFLYKTNHLYRADFGPDELKEISKLASQNTLSDLEKKSAGYDVALEKHRKN